MGRLAAQGYWSQGDINNWNRLFNKSVKLLQIPAERDNNPEAQFFLAALYNCSVAPHQHRDTGKFLYWLGRAVENGSAAAQYQMGLLCEEHRSGPDSRQDLEFAERLFRSASEQGHSEAMLHVGFFLETGRCGKCDERAAEEWYGKAAKDLGAKAYLQIANWYTNQILNHEQEVGTGVPRFSSRELRDRLRLAIKWYKKAAESGEPTALLSLGNIFWRGYGASPDLEEAEKWFRKASESTDSEIMEEGKKRLDELRRSPTYWIKKVGRFISKLHSN